MMRPMGVKAYLLAVAVAIAVGSGCGSVGSMPDAKPQPDAKPDAAEVPLSCTDGTKNGSETDTDCGGTCGGCDDGKVCVVDGDCGNGSCFGGTCGQRMFFADSSGADVVIPNDNTWTPIAGTNMTFTTYVSSQAFIRWQGTVRYAGTNAVCHVALRFKIDGVATGEPTFGDAIVVLKGSTRWHQPFNVELSRTLAPGTHSVSVEAADHPSYGACNFDGDGGLAYDRSHLAVALYDPTASWSAESTGTSGALGNSSAWTDIPGVSMTIPLTAASFVQLSMQGSSYSATNGATTVKSGHCAYRLVIDSTPLGDANHGQTIAVTDAISGWWQPVTIKWGAELTAGNHTVTAQVRNSGASNGTCEANQANLPYSKFHLFANASPVGKSFAAESTGADQSLSTIGAWTDITGAAVPFSLAKAGPIQVEVAGTQYVAGTVSGHCAYRLAVDGTPLGDTDHGQAIVVGDPTYAWWDYVGLLYGTQLPAGPHDVKVQFRNSGGGDCHANRDSAGYGRTRVLVRSF
jgi:hypothetical protein